jgi:peptidoglycan hydrolase CwlO-like protein
MQKKSNKIIYFIMILVIGLVIGLWTPRLMDKVHANYMQQQIDKANEEITQLGNKWNHLEKSKNEYQRQIEEWTQEQKALNQQADEIREWIKIQEGLLRSRKAQ